VQKKPFLAHACEALLQYYKLHSRHAFGIALLQVIGESIENRHVRKLSKHIEVLAQMGWITVYEIRYHTSLAVKPVMISIQLS